MVFLAQGLNFREQLKETACIVLESSRGGHPNLETSILFINNSEPRKNIVHLCRVSPSNSFI